MPSGGHAHAGLDTISETASADTPVARAPPPPPAMEARASEERLSQGQSGVSSSSLFLSQNCCCLSACMSVLLYYRHITAFEPRCDSKTIAVACMSQDVEVAVASVMPSKQQQRCTVHTFAQSVKALSSIACVMSDSGHNPSLISHIVSMSMCFHNK